jgi:hypothetical protein
MHTFLIALVTGLWTGSALLLFAVIRSPRDLVLRYFALVVLLLALQQTWAIDEYSTPTLARLAINVLGLWAAFGKVCFFRTALHRQGRPRPRLHREALVVVCVAAVEVATMLLAPPEIRPAMGQPRNGHFVEALIFELVTTGYLASVSCRVIRWTWRLLRRVDNNLYRVSLALVGFASTISLLSGALDVVVHITAFAVPSTALAMQPYYVFIYFPVAVGFGIFFAGAMTPVFVEAFWSIPVAVLQLTEYRMMGTLWGALRGEFPKMNLRRQWGIHRRYYRRGVEIRDGLVLLKDYYNADVAEVAERASRNRGENVAVTAMVVAAALVREALKAHQEGRLPERRHAVPTSGASDWATDTAWIVSLARAFASSTPTAPPPAVFSALSPR